MRENIEAVRGFVAPRRVALWVSGAVAYLLVYAWDDMIFAVPVAAATAWFGPWTAFLVLSVVYAGGSYLLAMLVVRAYRHRADRQSGRLMRVLGQQSEKSHGLAARRVLTAGRYVGFVLSSVFAGGILTTYFLRRAGRTHNLKMLAAVSCAIFGVSFVGWYAGIFSLVF